MVPNHYFIATFPLLLVCVNFLSWADATTHILFGRRQMRAPEMGAWFQGQHLDSWLGCVPVCARGYAMPPGDVFWLVCDRVGMSVLSPWQPFSLWFLYICSVMYSIWETAPHLISNHKADDRDSCWVVCHFPGCLKLYRVVSRASKCSEPSLQGQ